MPQLTKSDNAHVREGNRYMLLSDRPITCAGEDQLGFQPFASNLAKGLRDMAPAEGLVVALHAPWGSGKTSALNLLERHLAVIDLSSITGKSIETLSSLAAARSDSADKDEVQHAGEWEHLANQHKEKFTTTVVRFNPWYFSGQETVFKAFFGVMGTELSLANDQGVASAVAALLRRGAEAGGAIGATTGMIVAGPAGAMGGAAVGGFFGRVVGDRFERSESLDASLEALREALRQRRGRILVVLDDIDRLVPDELRQMLTIIKSLGNLPNITYLVAYDQMAVTQLLSKAGIDNVGYLEKIVQVSFQLPTISRTSIRKMLFNRMDAILKDTKLPDERRWGEAFHLHIEPRIKTPRDVTRLCNSLQVIWPAVENEVDWSDLVILELIRLNEPYYYSLILQNLEALTGATSSLVSGDGWAKPLMPIEANSTDPERLKRTLLHLFPRLANEWKESAWDSMDDLSARRHRRIRSGDYARNYFTLSPSPDQFSASDIRSLLAPNVRGETVEALLANAKNRKSSDGLTMVSRLLPQLSEEITAASPLPLVTAKVILKRSNELSELRDAERHFFVIDNDQRLIWVFLSALRALQLEARVKALKSWFDGVLGIPFLVPFVDLVTSEAGRAEGLLPKESHSDLRKVACDAVATAATDPNFFELARPAHLIFSWASLGGDEPVSRWIKTAMDSDRGLINLARIIPGEVHSSDEGTYLQVNRNSWSKLLDIDAIVEKLKAAKVETNTPTIDRFMAALERGNGRRKDRD